MKIFNFICNNIMRAVLMIVTLVLVSPAHVVALSAKQKKVIQSGSSFFNVEETLFCEPGTSGSRILAAGSKIYMLGDSLTQNAKANLETSINAAGFSIAAINADSGRAISVDTSGNDPPGLMAVDTDKELIKGLGSGAVVVALGTNSGTEDLNVQIPALINKIREHNSSAHVFWVNLFYENDIGSRDARNNIITGFASSLNFSIIDTTQAAIELSSDNIHPTGNGYVTFAQTISNSLKNASNNGPRFNVGSGDSEVFDIVGGESTDGNPSHILSYIPGLDEQKAANAINTYIASKKPESPFVGLGSSFLVGAKKYNVNPFLAVGHLKQENGFATASSGWHTTTPPSFNAFGRSASQSQPHTIYVSASGRTRLVYKWTSWAASLDGNNGTEDPWFALINRRYLGNREGSFKIASGDFETYISHYAPQGDGNNEASYVQSLKATIDELVALVEGGVSFTGGNSGGNCNQPSDGNVNTEGYAFPLAPQTRTSYSTLPCNAATCHHDNTPAFDLSYGDVAGKSVYAIYSGVIVKINTQEVGYCQSIQLKADDGYYYWYGHVIDVIVSEEQEVDAGDEIAKVADWTEQHTCNGTSTGDHLHIDRGCSIDGVPQWGGNKTCRDPTFVPLLNSIYESLPA